MLYDIFISHASEDKNDFVRPLASKLQEQHVAVWYDEFSLKPGDSLRRSIDIGLTKSRYGIVILSQNFFNKKWTQWELDGLIQRQNSERSNLILPIWHNITGKEVISYSPSLADKIAIRSNQGLDVIVRELLKVIKPEGSTLIIARDQLMKAGFETPVVTDDWWLDLVGLSESNNLEGSFQEPLGWNHWGFPLPIKENNPRQRANRLAQAALQKNWQNEAAARHITQITEPKEVLDFIHRMPGLTQTCHDYPIILAAYDPQLTIKGFGGEFETHFNQFYKQSLLEQEKERLRKSPSGTALTVNKLAPACDEGVSLRHPNFGDYEPEHIACWYVQGHIMGPPVKIYQNIDYILWLLSDQSLWLPKKIRNFLTEGMKNWVVWAWHFSDNDCPDFEANKNTGILFNKMFDANKFTDFVLTEKCMTDIETRFAYTKEKLDLKESKEELIKRFLSAGFIKRYIELHTRRKQKRK